MRKSLLTGGKKKIKKFEKVCKIFRKSQSYKYKAKEGGFEELKINVIGNIGHIS